MGKRSIALRKRTSRSLELPRVFDETNNPEWEPRQIRSFSPLSSNKPSSPRSKTFRFPKSLLTRGGRKKIPSEVSSPPKESPPRKNNKNPLSPVKRRRLFSAHFLRRPVFFVRNVSRGSKGSTGTATDSSEDDHGRPHLSSLGSTRVFAVSSPRAKTILEVPETMPEPEEESQQSHPFSCATAILGESYLELCGIDRSFQADDEYHPRNYMPEDPTIQQSLECIFASQLTEGLNLWEDDEEVESISIKNRPFELQSPAALQQSRLNRSTRRPSAKKRIRKQRSLQYLGECDPAADGERSVAGTGLECPCDHSGLPPLNPESWPQAPLLLRPTRDSGTRIKGVRLASEKELFWTPESGRSWTNPLGARWGKVCHDTPTHRCCEKCAILPINNGNEMGGESLVVDFETDDFEGTLLLRLRFSEGTTPEPYDDSKGYFQGLNRRYQAVVRGRFKKEIPLTELSTGFRFDRPCGKLPPKWILRGALKVLKFFAPQLDARLDGDNPHSLSPLGSMPQSISVETEESDLLDGIREEPNDEGKTLLGEASQAGTSVQRAKFRKRNFDKLFVQGSKEKMTDPSKIYTFEFLQHLFDFEEFSIELGSMVGSVKLEEVLDGQPLQFMATHGDKTLWSFDIWHKCLWERAVAHDRVTFH